MNNFLNLHQSLVKSKEDLPSYLAAIKENQTFQVNVAGYVFDGSNFKDLLLS